MRKYSLGLMICLALCTAPLAANASVEGYICQFAYRPQSSQNGEFGFVEVELYTLPNCSGTKLDRFLLCTKNATSGLCPENSTLFFSENGINIMSAVIQRAQQQKSRLKVTTDDCEGSLSGYVCPKAVWFFN
jgi:hypothetical protein